MSTDITIFNASKFLIVLHMIRDIAAINLLLAGVRAIMLIVAPACISFSAARSVTSAGINNEQALFANAYYQTSFRGVT